MRSGIATVSLSGELRAKLAAAAAAGFDGVEIFENDFLASDAGPAEVGRLVADSGLSVLVFQPFRDFEGLPDPQRQRAFDRAERKFDVMHALGTDLMLVCSNVSPHAIGGIERAAADLHELGERAAKRGLRVGYEALAWGRFVNDHRDAWEIVRRADHPAVGLILDSFHTLTRNIDPRTIEPIPGDRIFLVHVADAPRLTMDPLSWSRHFRCMPGQGDLPIVDFLTSVARTGYDGFLSLEIFNDQFRSGSASAVAIDGRRSLLAAMDMVRRRSGQAVAGFPALPEPVECEGTEFIEFAMDEAAAGDLAKLLPGMGFTLAGRHISKDVTWWRQGNVNLVVNCEQEGFAHASWITHGPSVCAIGLRVSDAKAAAERATALLAKSFVQEVPTGELTVPAIRGVGGSLMYFLDRHSELAEIWEREFRSVGKGSDGETGAGIVSVDHVSQTMDYDEMLSWLLFYTAILGFEKTTELDVVDPAGLVGSRAVRNQDESVRFTLNGARSRGTLSGRFLEEFFGSGVQHIAFATKDILAASASLRTKGVQLLAIPTNYYDDLIARFGLDDDVVEAFRSANVLYDRDDNGEYLQIYTPTFADRFFFEIVERRSTYAGFGASNAPIRLAAQTRTAEERLGRLAAR